MKSKNLFLIFIFGLFILPGFAGAAIDLIITDFWPTDGGPSVSYTIKNQGSSSCSSGHYAYLYVDGSQRNTDMVSSALSGGASSDYSFDNNYWWTCSGVSDTIQVCADGGSVRTESDETNNCRTENWVCQPDLIITGIGFGSGYITYDIKNQGALDAGSSRTYLYIDGVYKAYHYLSSLDVGESNGSLGIDYPWTCSGSSDTIQVCADGENSITESNESNNCFSQTVTCPDLIINDIWLGGTYGETVYYNIQNQGQAPLPSTWSYNYLYVDGVYETWDVGSNGDQYYSSGWSCGGCDTHSVEICADKAGPNGAQASGGGDLAETSETNNCRKETFTCPMQCCGNLTLEISGSVSCTVTPDLCSTCCNGKSWQIKDDSSGVIKCSGTISNDAFCPACTGWTVGEGTYSYTLYIGGVSVASDSVTCPGTPNVPPTCVYLDASPASGNAPLAVSFLANGSDSDGTINQYEFDFGDGSPLVYSTTTGATHTYNATGTYCAKLRVKDNNGAWSVNTGSCPGGVCTAQITVTGGGPVISSPSVVTNPATNIASTSATLNGNLLSLGYDPGTCPNCKSIVWFEWGATGTAGVSGSYGSSTTPTTVTVTGPFMAVVSLTPGKTYYFEAFAKNGGSW